MELSKHFEHKAAEAEIYKRWEESGFFDPDKLPGDRKQPFTIIMPPPNANGSLHIGHALFVTTQDIMIRYKRMQGFKTLWLPGMDHAGFETQVVYAKKIEKEGRRFFDIPKEQLYKEILDFTLANKSYVEGQIKALGASCDWSREKFTLDEDIKKVVYETFKMLYDDGLIYRGRRIINWCAKHRTSLSDLEIIQQETNDTLYYLQYGPFVIATARPETKFGDKYVVVHPDDPRYSQYKDGQKFEFEWINGPVAATLIKDPVIDMSFGTGAMTITPAHDAADFDINERHQLFAEEAVIDWNGTLLPIAGEFMGQHISKARPLIVQKLKDKGLLVKEEPYVHSVPVCYKCNTPIEPQAAPQWFVAMTKKPKGLFKKSLRDMAVSAVKKGEVQFTTERFKEDFLRWMENLRDWNISRQIVWGIRIPVWSCQHCEERKTKGPFSWKQGKYIGDRFDACPTCGEKPGFSFYQEEDVFDTWFSSGQWPYATLMTTKPGDFETFYPTDVMETGWDILFFWVARMIMFGKYRTGKAPFKTVYLHGLVRDKERQKMSKSKGNVIDPLGVAGEYGTDAVRMALISGNAPGTDPVISEDKIRGYRNFTTKIWNMAKFTLTYMNSRDFELEPNTERYKEILSELKKVKGEVTQYLDEYKLHLAAETIYHYTWHTVADKIIEELKPRLQGENREETSRAANILVFVFSECLKMLHPFMPFVTEEIWQKMQEQATEKKLLMVERW